VPSFLLYRLAALAGLFWYAAWRSGRSAAQANLRIVLPDASPAVVSAVARRSFQNYLRYVVELLRLQHLDADELRASVDDRGAYEASERALARGRGLIIATTHMGNWDLGGVAAVLNGFNLAVIAEGFADERLEREVLGAREELGMRVLRMERPGPSLVRHLREGGVLAVLCDRPLSAGGVQCEFFGGPVRVPAGVARLALASGAPIMPMAYLRTRRNGLGGILLHGNAIWPEALDSRAASVAALTQRVLDAHEPLIRRFPEQWYMFRRMWGEPAQPVPDQRALQPSTEPA
jgi:KDO2-lipid IV(A) lauroyltransferase